MMTTSRTIVASLLAALAVSAPLDASFAKAKSCKALAVIDTDSDASLSLDEAKAAGGAVFDRLNRDKDSTLDRKELKGRLSKKEIASGDPDKDSTIDKSEYLSIVEARFKAANGDADTTIDCKELNSRAGHALLRLIR